MVEEAATAQKAAKAESAPLREAVTGTRNELAEERAEVTGLTEEIYVAVT